ncbi:MAG: NAD(P)/FAD-dependent oxidoreductase [Methanothrix sp.]|uniref:FAD dependent oxidoreductase n=1 Tax=Methanothrix thermoacetophila (strain DSM 6194 / JCM 14653 / NBRC 101360 / PT) TaxID=349307 RepID=A0B912_METTP|nr:MULTISPECIES: NAD(P)/FAD-dependent oxidoreductase [Methanothrix]ABK15186.1 FAD dependent oxidoreductase [Methanothrix thermoacetophila PT]MBC7079230.1 NAD(P)/FAD-dependent oxidoreductase [Methanothrix sp.]NPU86694.1 NAD(P)/FAD-dependent oxidoreductase [Methanothrix sp.]
MQDVVVVGAGPAGLFAALELSVHGKSVVVVDKGRDISERNCPMKKWGHCLHCEPCHIMCGMGGAGTYSDGILNLHPAIGGDLTRLTDDPWALVDEVDSVFLRYGAPLETQEPTQNDVEELSRRAASVGARFIPIKQRHMGSDRTPEIIREFSNDLKRRGVRFVLNSSAADLIIEKDVCMGVRLSDGGEIRAESTLLAPGRIGAEWIGEVIERYGIKARYGPLDVGVRVEVPSIVMDPVTRINRDPKFHIITHRYDDFIRTFCTNPGGFVVKEEYRDFIATNGHSMSGERSENTNFAFLVRLELTKPIENTTAYGISIAKLVTTIGGRRPVIQRLGDLHRGRRSTGERIARNPVRNTLKDVTPGDISMALPHRIVMDVIEGLEILNEIIPGVNADSTLLYAPEIKFYAREISVDKDLQTSIQSLYAAGDGAGLSRGIVAAAATGLLAARGILRGE